jgi:HK97 family phage prohead protease
MQTKQRLDFSLNLKSINDAGEFEGYGSVFGVKDSYSDIVVPGAFQKSLKAWGDKGKLPAMLWQHNMNEPIGIYTEMREDDVGLYVKGRLLIADDPLAKRAHAHMKAGSITGLSIGYILNDYVWNKDKQAYELKEVDLWEVSLVTFPSNDEARIAEVKGMLDRGEIPPPSKVEKALREAGFSSSQAKGIMAKGYSAIAPREAGAEALINMVNAIKV